MADAGWWFSFVTAAPVPETGESVNVGIVVGNGNLESLTYVRGLPRLMGLATGIQRKVFESVLESAAGEIRRGLDLAGLKAAVGPQLRVSEARLLRHPPASAVLDVLKRRYLAGPHGLAGEVGRRLVRESLNRLDNALSASANFEAMQEILKRPEPKRLYPSLGRANESNIPTLGRVVRGRRRDLLVDAVLLRPGQATHAVRSATERIGRAFWYYDKLKGEIENREGRVIRLVGALTWARGGVDDRDLVEAGQYITENWTRHAEVISDLGDPGKPLAEHLDWVAGG